MEATPLKGAAALEATPTVRSLSTTFVLFGLLTVAQIVGGIVADSFELQSDAALMSVDLCTYALNIVAETKGALQAVARSPSSSPFRCATDPAGGEP